MSVFREKSLERISSPEALDNYLQVTNPPLWLGLGAAILLLVGAVIWGIFGRLESTVKAVTVCSGGEAVCYVSEADFSRIELSDEVHLGDHVAHVVSAENEGTSAQSVLNDYSMHLAELQEGEYVHALQLDSCPQSDGSYASSVVVESIPAIRFLLN